MLRMVPVAGTMMLFEAKEDTLGNLGTGEQDGQAHAPSPPLTRGSIHPTLLYFTGWFEEIRGP